MNTSFCHLLIPFFVVSRNTFEYTFQGEKRDPEDFTDFGKALRVSYLFSVLAQGFGVHPKNAFVNIQMLCSQNTFLQETIATHPDARTKSYISHRESTVDSPCPQKRNSP